MHPWTCTPYAQNTSPRCMLYLKMTVFFMNSTLYLLCLHICDPPNPHYSNPSPTAHVCLITGVKTKLPWRSLYIIMQVLIRTAGNVRLTPENLAVLSRYITWRYDILPPTWGYDPTYAMTTVDIMRMIKWSVLYTATYHTVKRTASAVLGTY